jgi:Domain of unknown function (DUF6285)
MQDQPSAPELLDAVAEYLSGELRPEVSVEQRFKVLVAANVCAVVARELRAGDGPDLADASLFADLLDGDADAGADALAARLAERIRAGDFDARLPELMEALRAHSRRKLEVSRPSYENPDM